MAELVQGQLQGEDSTSEALAMLLLAIPVFAICRCEVAFCLPTNLSSAPLFGYQIRASVLLRN